MSDIYNTEDLVLEPEVEDILDTPVPGEPTPAACPDCGDTYEPLPTPVTEPEPIPDYTPELFFGTLQSAVMIFWKYHLATNKHFEHVELERTYHCLLSCTDRMIEVHQGYTGQVIDPSLYYSVFLMTPGEDVKVYIQKLVTFIRGARVHLFDSENYSEMGNLIDEVLTELDTVYYKLNTFKENPIQTFEEFTYANRQSINESCGCDCGCEDCDCDDEDGNDEEEE